MMEVLSTVLAIILSIGLTQGVVFAIILWNKVEHDWKANRYKSILLLLLSYGLLNQVMRLFGVGYYDFWYHITLDLSWSYGPLIYLYVKAQCLHAFKFSRKDYWTIAPIAIQIVISVYVRSQNFFWDGTRDSLTWLGYYGYAYWRNFSTEPIIASLLIMFFAYRSFLLLRKVDPTEVDESNLQAVKRSVAVFGGYYFIVLVILVADLSIYLSTVNTDYYYFTRFYYYPFFIGTALLVYWLGISSIVRSDDRVIKPTRSLSSEERENLEAIEQNLRKAMEEEQIFKDGELTLGKLADRLSVKSYLVSKCFSEVVKKSFNDYVNEYRVKEVQNLLKDPQNEKYTLLALAFEAGFNSKSSFNRAVRKHLGISPSEIAGSR
jgi:AraC-like DNA-binding protein